MFSRKKKNYRVFVVTALVIAICVLIVMIFWPEKPEANNEVNANVQAETRQEDTKPKVDIENEQLEDTKQEQKSYYIVKKNENMISVFFVTEDGKELKLEDTEILYDLLPEEDQANFNKGIILEEYEQLASLLQDFEG